MIVVAKDKVLKKGKWQQTFKVYDADGKALKAGKDYEKEAAYEKLVIEEDGSQSYVSLTEANAPAVKAGDTIRLTVTGAGDYAGTGEQKATISTTYRLMEASYDISKAKIRIYDQPYNGRKVTVEATKEYFDDSVTLNGKKLFDENGNALFEIVDNSYQKNDKKGTAKVTVRGLAPFAGERVVTFKITQRDIGQVENWWERIPGISTLMLLLAP